jgi:hypothetical protein
VKERNSKITFEGFVILAGVLCAMSYAQQIREPALIQAQSINAQSEETSGRAANRLMQQGAHWAPDLNTSWQIQFKGPIDLSLDAAMYDLDLFGTDATVVKSLHDKGRKAVCYISAGSWEKWRPDAKEFPKAIKGKDLAGWPGEAWLDIRRLDILGPIMVKRMKQCKEKGFDALDPDNIDGYTNKTGFPLTYKDQLTYNKFLASEAHKLGLSIGLKNDLLQVKDLVSDFDFSINEQCFKFKECDYLTPFIAAGKPVFNIEYELSAKEFCDEANKRNFNSIRKRRGLDAYRESCR